jgi:PAS domain S-box-containing protein
VRAKAPVVYNDFGRSPNQKGLPPGHTPLSRVMTIPVMESGRVRLIFGVGNKKQDYTPGDTARLQVVANELNKIMTQRRVQAALRASNKRFRDVTEAAGEFIWETDAQGQYTYVSQACFPLLGYSEEELVGRRFFHELHPERGREEYRRAGLAFVSRRAVMKDLYHRLETKDGQVLDVLTSAVPILGEDGALVGYRGVDRNITERRRAEKEKEKLEAQLLQAQKMESIGRLAGGVAHDFNNMLCVILGHAQLAMLPLDANSPTRESLMEIQEAAQRSAELTRQLLAFARKQTVHPQVLDLNETVAGTIKMLRRLIGEDIDLVWAPASDLWKVSLDPSQIDQILANLAVNARDAIAGTGTVSLHTQNVVLDEEQFANEPGFTGGEFVLLSVRDTGAGMHSEVLAHIFEPFFTTKEVGKGTGLGLATVYGVVKQNNGYVDVVSSPGKGTEFLIYLPRHKEEPVDEARASVASRPKGGTETVLLVDDEAAVVELGRRMLAKLGYTVLIARSPGEALRIAGEHVGNIDLLITDVVMPEMNGRELADRLAAVRPGLKQLFVSGHPAEVIARRGVLEEGVALLEKPFSIQSLAKEVRKALE